MSQTVGPVCRSLGALDCVWVAAFKPIIKNVASFYYFLLSGIVIFKMSKKLDLTNIFV